MGKRPDVPAKRKGALFHKVVLLIRILCPEPLNLTLNAIQLR